MPDQTPAPFSDRELTEYATGSTVASNPYAAVQDLATEFLAARERITELEAVADRNSKLYIKAAPQLAEARGWATWFAAERDYVNRHRREELAINRAHMDRMAVDMDAKDARITELEAGLDESRADAGRAHGNAGALHARVTELLAQVTARDARITELEAEQTPREPDAYIAVNRHRSPLESSPGWDYGAYVIPAGDLDDWQKERDGCGWELLPIVADGDGTRWAAAQTKPEPSLEPGELCPHEEAKRWLAAHPAEEAEA